MSLLGCNFKCNCAASAVIASIIVGINATFLQFTAVITVTPAFLWVTLGIAVVYLAVLAVTSAIDADGSHDCCTCSSLNVALTGILGTVLLSLVLLAVGIVATSLLSAILVGGLLLFFSLILTGIACYVRCSFGCGN